MNIVYLLLSLVVFVTCESFDENLHINTLLDGKLHARFHFEQKEEISYNDSHFQLIRKSIRSVLEGSYVRSLHLSMTQGRWKYDKWGRMEKNKSGFPSGLQLEAEFFELKGVTVEEQWKKLIFGLSGLLCSSVNFLDVDQWSYASGTVVKRDYGFYGVLPQETVCTENLTPFKSLLPNRGFHGIASLLNPLKIYDCHFHAISMDYVYNEGKAQLNQTVNVVFDLLDGKIGKERVQQNWSLEKIFDRQIRFNNPLATSSFLRFSSDFPDEFELHGVISNGELLPLQPEINLLGNPGLQDVEFSWKNSKPISHQYSSKSLITANRFQTGSGLFDGGMSTKIENHSKDSSIILHCLEVVPWIIRIYFHQMTILLDGVEIFPDDLKLLPAKDRQSPNVISFTVQLPANSSLLLSYHFEKVFLRFTEHAPDANRGFDLPSGIISYCQAGDQGCSRDETIKNILLPSNNPTIKHYFTEAILVVLPTPDFSMPYNVIALTSTILALFFGSLYNAVIKNEKKINE